MKTLNICLLLSTLFSLTYIISQKVNDMGHHHCNWQDNGDQCNYEGDTIFYSDYEEGSDGYYYDLSHWQHPDWSRQECEMQVHQTEKAKQTSITKK